MLIYIVLIVAIIVYFTFIKPVLNNIQSFKSDKELSDIIDLTKRFEIYDRRSYNKFTHYMKNFMIVYSQSFSDSHVIHKLKKHKYKLVGYLRKINMRLPNDVILQNKLLNNIQKLNIILENYINEACDRCDKYYFQTTA